MPDPQDPRQAQGDGHKKSLQCTLSINPASQQEIQPDQSRIVGFDREADCEAQDADGDKLLTQKTPHGHHAKADNDSGSIACNREHFAVGKEEANEKAGSKW